MCGESWLAKEIFNPQFSSLGIQVSLAIIICLFVWVIVGWVRKCSLKLSIRVNRHRQIAASWLRKSRELKRK